MSIGAVTGQIPSPIQLAGSQPQASAVTGDGDHDGDRGPDPVVAQPVEASPTRGQRGGIVDILA